VCFDILARPLPPPFMPVHVRVLWPCKNVASPFASKASIIDFMCVRARAERGVAFCFVHEKKEETRLIYTSPVTVVVGGFVCAVGVYDVHTHLTCKPQYFDIRLRGNDARR
jgi:hypothetical protein